MKRIGLFTKKIYAGCEDDIGECCVVLPDKIKSQGEAEIFIDGRKSRCEGCYGCPESRKEIVNG